MSDTIDIYLGSLEVSKEDIRQSIINKGVTPEGGLTSYAKAIDDIYVPSTGNASVEYSSNGDYTINPQEYGYDALSGINVNVNVKSSGGSGKPMIPNGFAFESGDMSQVDFSQYDWSMVYDGSNFFNATDSSIVHVTNPTGDWSNFEQNFNGKFLSTHKMFKNCSFPSFPQLDTSNVLDMSYMFQYCGGVGMNTIPQMDTSNVLSMEYMFGYCSGLTSIQLLDTSNVLNMSYMFDQCTSLISVPQFDTSNVVNMEFMFRNCNKLETIPQFNTSKVTTMSYMFSLCSSLTSIPLLDISNVTNMSYMFNSCYALTSVPQLDTSNTTDMSYMFYSCRELTSVPLLDTSNVTTMSYMFCYCNKLTEVRFKGNPSKVTNVSNMFYAMTTTGTLYYDSRYDYSKIIAVIPATWTAVPYDVDEYESQLNQSN